MGVAYDMLSTKRGVEIEPVKFTAGANFNGILNTNTGSFGMIKSFAKNFALGETKNFQVRISKAEALTGNNEAVEFQWKLDEHDAYSAPQTFASTDGAAALTVACTATAPCELINNGDNTAKTGIYIYTASSSVGDFTTLEEGNMYAFTYDHQEGRAYEYGNAANSHQQIECSGRGACDAATGRCGCFDGFSGEACQRTTCANDCSGHGVCQSMQHFAGDSGSSYLGYDSSMQMGCKCDDGFRGPDCSLIECPSGDDPMGYFGGDGKDAAGTAGPAMDCSGRGLCDYSAGQCTCFKGYFGERCEYQTNFV